MTRNAGGADEWVLLHTALPGAASELLADLAQGSGWSPDLPVPTRSVLVKALPYLPTGKLDLARLQRWADEGTSNQD